MAYGGREVESTTRRGVADSKRLLVLFIVAPMSPKPRNGPVLHVGLRIQYKTGPKPKAVKVRYWFARRYPEIRVYDCDWCKLHFNRVNGPSPPSAI
jgi:hypothetical protein